MILGRAKDQQRRGRAGNLVNGIGDQHGIDGHVGGLHVAEGQGGGGGAGHVATVAQVDAIPLPLIRQGGRIQGGDHKLDGGIAGNGLADRLGKNPRRAVIDDCQAVIAASGNRHGIGQTGGDNGLAIYILAPSHDCTAGL